MEKLFNTVMTTQRHREIGYCEDSDFATIELLKLNPEEKELIVSFNDYKSKKEYIKYKGYAYSKADSNSYLGGMSREDQKSWVDKQGKISEKYAIKLMLQIRERTIENFSCISSSSFILIGRTLYVRYSKISDLKITIGGNMIFAHWISINIENHSGKSDYKLSKKNFDKIVKKEKAHWDKGNPNTKNIIGRTHSCFSKPEKVKWGEKYK